MKRSRLSQYKQNKLIELFVSGVTAGTAARLVGVNKNTAAYYFHRLRLLIFHSRSHLEMFDGEAEADESYFGGHCKGRRGRGAVGKVAVFGLLKRNGKVYTVAVPNTQTATLLPIIREQVKPDASFIQIVIRAMMCRMSVSLATCASTTVHTLPKGKTTSMG